MTSLDLMIRRTRTDSMSKVSRLIIASATAALVVLTPTVSTLAAPGSSDVPGTVQTATHQDDGESPQIVPSSGSEVAESDDDPDVQEPEADEVESDAADRTNAITRSGIVSTAADLQPNQWMGAMDGRLVEPFAAALQPARVRSEAIGLDAEITVREIVNSEMQTPKDEFEVSWYKETGSPGKKGTNIVLAGHLNWYTTPEAVFHNIDEFEKGDLIVVTGEDGFDYTYEVKWVKLIETGDADMEKLVGPTKRASLTLITCGGEWDSAAGQYAQRTVVRAELVKR